MRKKVLGITGGVGAGKSTVLSYLQEKYHAYVIYADLVAHTLMQTVCYDEIVSAFGTKILNPDKTIDRAKLSDVVFCSSDRILCLNRIVHPAVKKRICEMIEENQKKEDISFFVVEAALLIEDH